MTAAVSNPELVGEAAVMIGSANLVVAIDARRAQPGGGHDLGGLHARGSAPDRH
jgi:imidazole glycerol phosphate synthase subunit HisF